MQYDVPTKVSSQSAYILLMIFNHFKHLHGHSNVTAVDIMAHKSSKTKNFDRTKETKLNSALMELGIYQENSCFTPNNLTV